MLFWAFILFLFLVYSYFVPGSWTDLFFFDLSTETFSHYALQWLLYFGDYLLIALLILSFSPSTLIE